MTYYTFDEASYRPQVHEGTPATEPIRLALSRPLARKMGLAYGDLPEIPETSVDVITIFARTVGEAEILAQIDKTEVIIRSQFPTFEFDEHPVDYGVVILLNFNSEVIDDSMQTVGWRFYQAPRDVTKGMIN